MTIEAELFDRQIMIDSSRDQNEQVLLVYSQLPQGTHNLTDRLTILVLKDGSGFLMSSEYNDGLKPEVFYYLDPKLNPFFSVLAPLKSSSDLKILRGVILAKEGPNP